MEQLGQGAGDLADSLAKQQAQTDLAKGVTRDAAGNYQVATPSNSLILGKAGEDYNAAIQQGAKAALSSNVSGDIAAVRAANPTDPQAFKAGADAVIDHYRQAYPGAVGNALADQGMNEATQYHTNMAEKLATIGVQESLQAITTQNQDAANRMKVLARNGAINTPEYDQLQDKLQDGYDALGSNPLFGYSQERIDSEKAAAFSELNGQFVVGRVDEAFARTGGDGGRAGAMKMINDQIWNNPDLQVSDQTRDHLKAVALAHLDYLTNEQKANIDASRVTTGKVIERFSSDPASVTAAQLDQALAQAGSVGDGESVLKIRAAQTASRLVNPTSSLPPEQALRSMASTGVVPTAPALGSSFASEQGALQYFQSKGWSPAQAAGIVGNLVHESGGKLNPAAINRGDGSDGSDSIGIGQWNSTRAAALKQFASAAGKPATDFNTQLAFVQHELETSESGAAARLKAAQTPQDAASAFALGYERPQGFQTGDISKVAGGQNRLDQTTRLATGGASSTLVSSRSNGPAFTPQQYAQNPFLLAAELDATKANAADEIRTAKQVGEALDIQFRGGNLPAPESVAAYQQVASRHSELNALSDKISAHVSGASIAQHATDLGSPDAGQAYVDQVQQLSQGQDLNVLQAAETGKAIFQKQSEALKSDPWSEMARRNWITRAPIPLNTDDPKAFAQGMAERAGAASALGSITRNAATPALAPNEVAQIKSVMTSGTLDQRTALLGSIANAGMSEPVLRATLGKLAESKETLPLAVAGSLMRDNPDAARSVIEGHALMQAEPKLAPNKDDFPGELAKAIPFNDLPAGTIREGIAGAAQAAYAKMSAAANDTTAILNNDRLAAAIKSVTGGISDYRGSKVIAPWYGASQEDTDGAIRALTDADFAGAKTADGNPFPASALKPSFSAALTGAGWRLQSYGDGKYLVFAGADDKRSYLGNGQGGKFVLDLGAKRSQIQNAAAGSVNYSGSQAYTNSDISSGYLIENP